MAAHHGLYAIAAAALTTAILLTRWCATHAVRDVNGAGAARTPWRRTTPHNAPAQPAGDRVAELHASFLDPALRETEAHLEQHWNTLESLHPHRDSRRS
ncbi:hypothetical protein ACIO7M_12420 [Streptomyces toxytricini]|uniref:Secreted protein n=1 Tax=Streptomyces toxytricini TaxID=67369 RepID=A0ABW8EH11_STRT5